MHGRIADCGLEIAAMLRITGINTSFEDSGTRSYRKRPIGGARILALAIC
jgi:hypothetical protein